MLARELAMPQEKLDIAKLAQDHYERVFRFCARRIGTQHAADAAQDTFLTAQKALKRFEGKSDVVTWLLGIAHNSCRRIARERRVQPLPLEFIDPPQDLPSETRLVDREALRSAFAKLSPEHRHVVILKEIEGMSYEECALVLGIPTGTVKSRLHHAFQLMRKSLGDSIETVVPAVSGSKGGTK